MKTSLCFLTFSIFLSSTAVFAVQPGNIRDCSTDSYTSERIIKDIPENQRVSVLNSQGNIIGAFHQDSRNGNLHALYLCGENVGYYYVEGNLKRGTIESIYNDEYEVDVQVAASSGFLKLNLSIHFSGDAEDADYGPFAMEGYVKIP